MKEETEDRDSLKVRILDREYRIKRKGEEDSYYEKIAKYVDQRMRSIVEKSSVISVDRVSVLAALRICEELFKVKQEGEEEQKILEKKLKEMAEMIQSAIN